MPILCLAAILLLAASPAPHKGEVAMRPQPGTPLDATARELVKTDLQEAGTAGETPLLLVAEAPLGGPKDRPAIFVQLQSARECGSAGCSTAIYLFRGKDWVRVLDSVSGPIRIDPGRHGGLHDLIVNNRSRWIWNGKAYVDTRPGPALNLKPVR